MWLYRKLLAGDSFIKKQVIVLFILAISFSAFSQKPRQVLLKPDVYNNIIRANIPVRVQTIDKGKVQETDTTPLKNIQVPVDRKSVLQYSKKVSGIDIASYKQFSPDVQNKFPQADLQIIPELHVEAKESSNESSAGNFTSYRIVFASLEPFRYDYSQKKFNSQVAFFLLPEAGSTNEPISEPVTIQVVSNDVESINPTNFQIVHLNIPSQDIKLVSEGVSDSAAIKVITTSNPEGYIAYLKVRPSLEISTNRLKLQGMGIQKIPVTVRFLGSNSSDSVKVNLSVSKGEVSPNSVYVHYNTPTTVYLTSEGIGATRLSAVSTGFKSNELNLTYTFPWMFLLASILGGLIGSLLKYYFGSKEKKSSVKPVIGGILIGFLGAVAYYALGINLLGLSTGSGLNELAVLGFSALCAYFGISAIKMDGKK